MNLEWFNKILKKIASDMYKSKFEDYENRILEMEQKQQVILKNLIDNQNKLDKLEDRLYHSSIEGSKMLGSIETIISIVNNNKLLNKNNNESADIK